MECKHLSWTLRYNNNYFIIASRAYLQQSPTCSRVNNLVYICKDITPWSSGAYHVLLTGEVSVNGSDTLRNVCILQFICVFTHCWRATGIATAPESSFLVTVKHSSVGNPRGRCDAYSSKFSLSKKPRFIEPVGDEGHVKVVGEGV